VIEQLTQLSRDGRKAVPVSFTMRDMNSKWNGLLAAALLALTTSAGADTPTSTTASTLQKIQAAGVLRCGVVVAREDWNKVDLHGDLSSLDAEICKAVGIAALGTRAKIDIKIFNSEAEAEEGLSQSRVELVVGVTPSVAAAAKWKVAFGPPVLYDGLGVLVRPELPAMHVKDLAGRKLCVIDGTENDHVLEARANAGALKMRVSTWQEEGEMDDAMATHWCDAVGAYVTRLAPLRQQYRQLVNARILPELLTLSPVVPAYRRDDAQWGLLIDWTIHALVQAEASGVTRANVVAQKTSEDPVVQRLLGVDWVTSQALGLPNKDWAATVIFAVGNYGEIYQRTVGASLGLPRGVNTLWVDGGLMHALPIQ
jgi:general L-amino acid transport system substrate-binding protein